MKFRPLRHPLNWYPYDITGSIELLQAYVNDVEQQVIRQIARLESEAESLVVDESHPDDSPRIATIHLDLDDATWDFEAVFREYFRVVSAAPRRFRFSPFWRSKSTGFAFYSMTSRNSASPLEILLAEAWSVAGSI